jgi:oxygen-dependent protoporphyrinogen oxidase
VMMIVPSKVMPMVKSSLLGWGTKIGMGLELLRRPSRNGPPPDRSVAEFVIDHFGRETLDYLAEPLLSGVYGGDPAQLSAASVLPRFVEMETRYGSLGRAVMAAKRPPAGGSLFRTLKSGLGSMVSALSARLHVRHEEVETIEPGFRIRAGGDWMEAENVILACPAWSAAELCARLDPELSRLLGEIPYSSSVTLTMIYKDSEFDGTRAGFGFLVPACERQRVAACTFVGTKFSYRAPDDRVVLRSFLGGIGDPEILTEPDESIFEIARRELRKILGLTAMPVFQQVSRWPRGMAQYTVGHAPRVQKIRDRAAAIPGLYLAGNGYEGIGIPDCIRTARTAAAAVVLNAVSRQP